VCSSDLKETALRKPDWDLSECEAKRVDRDPFDTPHLEEETTEDYMDLKSGNTELSFVEAKTIELAKAKIRRTYSQYWGADNRLISESVTIEITNNDLEQRYQFKIGSKLPIVHNLTIAKMGEQPIITVETGSISLSRNKDRNQITLVIHGKKDVTLTYSVEGLIWLAEIVEKTEPIEISELDLAL
jgi:hypothetical protein